MAWKCVDNRCFAGANKFLIDGFPRNQDNDEVSYGRSFFSSVQC